MSGEKTQNSNQSTRELSTNRSPEQMLAAIIVASKSDAVIAGALTEVTAKVPDFYVAAAQGATHPSFTTACDEINKLFQQIKNEKIEPSEQADPVEAALQIIEDYWSEYRRLLGINNEPEDTYYSTLHIDLSLTPKGDITPQFLKSRYRALQTKLHPNFFTALKSEVIDRRITAISRNLNLAYAALRPLIEQQANRSDPATSSYSGEEASFMDQLDRRLAFSEAVGKIYDAFNVSFSGNFRDHFARNDLPSFIKINDFLLKFLASASKYQTAQELSLTLSGDNGSHLLVQFLSSIITANNKLIRGSLSEDRTTLQVSFEAVK